MQPVPSVPQPSPPPPPDHIQYDFNDYYAQQQLQNPPEFTLPPSSKEQSTSGSISNTVVAMTMPRCAICCKPTVNNSDCPHESDRLQKSIFQSEMRWLSTWIAPVRAWVTNESVKHVTSMFDSYRSLRLAGCRETARSLQYFHEYSKYGGNPPPNVVPPGNLEQLKLQLTDLDSRLQLQIDEDWKTCARMYPKVLDYFYSQVVVPNLIPSSRAYSPPVPSDYPSSPIDFNSPELDGPMTLPPEIRSLEEIPGGFYTSHGISALKARSRRYSQAGSVPIPIPQQGPPPVQSVAPSSGFPPHPAPSQRRSRRWSTATGHDVYLTHPAQSVPHAPAPIPVGSYGQSAMYGGGVSLSNGDPNSIPPGGVRISPTQEQPSSSSSRRRASYIQPSTSRNRLSAHFAEDAIKHQAAPVPANGAASMATRLANSKSSRRPSLPASHYYTQPGMNPPGGTHPMAVPSMGTANGALRHGQYYPPSAPQQVIAGRH